MEGLPPPRRRPDLLGLDAIGPTPDDWSADVGPDELYADPPWSLILAGLASAFVLFGLAALGLAGLLTGRCA
jgi:hypothetical protein